MKLEKLRKLLTEQGIDALLVTNPFNRRYMTGFTGTAGLALISSDDAVFITDFRYTEQAEKEIDGFRIVQHTKTIIEEVAEQAKSMKLKTIGFEKDDMTYGLYELYQCKIDSGTETGIWYCGEITHSENGSRVGCFEKGG